MRKEQIDFGDSDVKMKMIGVRIPPELVTALKHFAVDNHTSMQDITVNALRDYLKKHGVKVPSAKE